jgi:hypothetical protein
MAMSVWQEFNIDTRAAGLLGSPYYDWAQATAFAYYGDSDWLPVLIELTDDVTAEEFAQLASRLSASADPGWAAQLLVPDVYTSLPARLSSPTHFVAVLATSKFLNGLYGGEKPAEMIRGFDLGRRTPHSCGTPQALASTKQFKSTPQVVTGVIDDGIAFAHDRFLDQSDTTRIEYLWDQQVPSTVWGTWAYGREITKRAAMTGIDDLMKDCRHASLVDEDEVYRRSGFLDHSQLRHQPLAARVAHGTHVMDLACNSAQQPAADQRPIVAVQLPTVTVEDTSGATLAPQIYNGLLYIIDKAEQIACDAKAGQLPVVVNVSYGLIAGPHDGSSRLEKAIDELHMSCNPLDALGHPTTTPMRIVLPAGNNYLSRCHASFSLPAGGSQQLHWRVLPDDWTESSVQIWFPFGSVDAVSITITAPDETSSLPFASGFGQKTFDDNGNVVGRVVFHPPGDVGARAMVELFLAPTGYPDGGVPLATPGVWRITIHNAGSTDIGETHAWIQRDDAAPGYPQRGRQSYFDDPKYRRYNDGGRAVEIDADSNYVKRAGTLNAIATGTQTIVVGGFRPSDGAPATYSSSGPVLHPPGRGAPSADGPDAMLVSEDAPSHRGVLAAGTRSGSCASMFGTSVSAPQATQWLAERMAQGKSNDRNALFTAAASAPAPPPPPSPQRGGGGRLELKSNRPPRKEPRGP